MKGKTVSIVERGKVEVEKPMAITGFSGPGLVASTAAMWIVRGFNMREAAYLKTRLIPPVKVIVGNELKPSFRFYVDGRGSLLIVVNEGAIPSEAFWPISEAIMEWLSDKGVREVISLAGIPVAVRLKERRVYGYSTDRRRMGNFQRHGIYPLVDGVIAGINAGVLDECVRRKIPWTTIITHTAQMTTIDFEAAAAVVDALNKVFGFNIRTGIAKPRKQVERRGLLSRLKRL